MADTDTLDDMIEQVREDIARDEAEASDGASASLAPNRIVIQFRDDHSLDGMRIEVLGTTPEQIIAANWHLARAANQLQDALEMQRTRNAMIAAENERRDVLDVAASLRDPKIRALDSLQKRRN